MYYKIGAHQRFTLLISTFTCAPAQWNTYFSTPTTLYYRAHTTHSLVRLGDSGFVYDISEHVCFLDPGVG